MQPFLHAGGRDRQTATASLCDLCLKRDAVNAANMDVPLAFGTARESVCGMRRSGHPKPWITQSFGLPKVPGRSMLRDVQGFGTPKTSGHPRLRPTQRSRSFKDSGRPMFQVVQDFRSFKASDRPRIRVIQGFRSPKTSGRPNLRVPSFAHEKIEKKRGGV